MRGCRILQIGSGAEYGGGSTYLLTLMDAIRNHGGEAHFACTPGLTLEAVNRADYRAFPVPAMQREINPYRDLRAILQLIKIIRRGKYELVHTHTSKGGFLGRLAAKTAGVPVVFHTVHGFAFHEQSSRVSQKLYVTLEKIAACCCHRIISVNHEDRLKAIELGITSLGKIITIQNGINTAPFDKVFDRLQVRKKLAVKEDEFLVGTVARLAPQKAPLDFVHAAAHVCSQRQDVKFIMVGDGPLHEQTEQLVDKLNLGDRIILAGYRTDIPELLSAMDVFVLTSLWEGLPISLLEAMAMRKPVVATDIKGSREVVSNGETGWLVPPRDPVATGDRIIQILSRWDEAHHMGSRGRELVDQVFNASIMTEKTLAAYNELLRPLLVNRNQGTRI